MISPLREQYGAFLTGGNEAKASQKSPRKLKSHTQAMEVFSPSKKREYVPQKFSAEHAGDLIEMNKQLVAKVMQCIERITLNNVSILCAHQYVGQSTQHN